MATAKSQRRFTTDPDGRIPDGISLVADSVYVMQRPVPPAAFSIKDREQLLEWIDECVLGDLRSLASGALRLVGQPVPGDASRKFGGGNFLLAAGCCMAVEYFSWIYSGEKNATKGAQSFATSFIVPQNAKYQTYWPLLWLSLRNGIIHGSFPQAVHVEDRTNHRIICPVAIAPAAPHLEIGVHDGYPALFINSHQLLVDIERSVRGPFFGWLRSAASQQALDRGAARLFQVDAGNREVVKAIEAVVSHSKSQHRGTG